MPRVEKDKQVCLTYNATKVNLFSYTSKPRNS